ncbi:MAG TPA: hypothetical protein VF530_20265 [Planctomycetota bacterium]
MCPACLTTWLFFAGGTGSVGGLAALAVVKLKQRKAPLQGPRLTEGPR